MERQSGIQGVYDSQWKRVDEMSIRNKHMIMKLLVFIEANTNPNK